MFLFHGVHRQTNRHSREISEIVPAHARAHTHAEITRTPLSCGGDECDADSLLRQSYIQTYVPCVCVCVYIFFVCLLFWVYLTAVCLTLCFSSIQGLFICNSTSCRICHPTFLPGFHRFSECVCFSFLFTDYCAWVNVLNLCECVYVWVYMTVVWPNIKCLLHMDSTSALYTQASGHMDVHVQTDTAEGLAK